jgi:hypothetical protein
MINMLVKESIAFKRGGDPKEILGIGKTLYQQYCDIIDNNPELKIFYKGKEIKHFKESEDNPKEIHVGWGREHPMSGYGGRTSWMRFWGSIKYIKKEYRVRCFMVEDSGRPEKYLGSFQTLEEAIRFVIPDFQGLLSYYDEYTFGKRR